MNILNARVVWFPKKLSYISYDYLSNDIDWEEEHLKKVRKYIKEDGLIFPGVAMFNPKVKKLEIHCGHYRFKIAKEFGYDGISVYVVDDYKDVLYLTKFTEKCYEHYLELKKIKDINKPESEFI